MTQHLVRSFQKGLLPKCRGSLGAGKCTVDPSIQQLRPQPLFLCFLALPLPLLWQFEHLWGGAGTGFYFSGFEEPASAPTHRHRAPSAFGRRSSIAFYVEIRFLLLLWGMGSNIGECNFKTSKKKIDPLFICAWACVAPCSSSAGAGVFKIAPACAAAHPKRRPIMRRPPCGALCNPPPIALCIAQKIKQSQDLARGTAHVPPAI